MNNNQLRVIENENPKVVEYVPSIAQTVDMAAENLKQMYTLAKKVMRHKIDYDTIPGTPKPSLLKPGAERLLQFFGLGHKVECVNKIEDWEKGFFFYHYKVTITHPNHPGFVVAECEGSANSKEKKYRNQDPYTIVNTLQKMAIKRALVGATLQATGASGLFTQDIEDMDIQPERPQRIQQRQQKKQQPKQAAQPANKMTDEQRDAIVKAAEEKGITEDQLVNYIKSAYLVASIQALGYSEGKELFQLLSSSTPEQLQEVMGGAN